MQFYLTNAIWPEVYCMNVMSTTCIAEYSVVCYFVVMLEILYNICYINVYIGTPPPINLVTTLDIVKISGPLLQYYLSYKW